MCFVTIVFFMADVLSPVVTHIAKRHPTESGEGRKEEIKTKATELD